MNGPFLLDTNIISEIARRPTGHAALRLRSLPQSAVFTSVIVAAELHYGLCKNPHASAKLQVERLLDDLAIFDFDYRACLHYGTIRAALERSGKPIGANDLWIAAHALAEDATLVTGNIGEFSRIPALRVENWMQTA